MSRHRVHFIGIGGIGVSYLAQWYLKQGIRVTGSNFSEEPILKILRKKGAKIKVGHANYLPDDTELVIYTQAVAKNNLEMKVARARGIPLKSHPGVVGELTKKKYTIAVCGAHGKSTTTSMASLLLIKAGLDPTVFVGTILKEFGGTNCKVGKSKYLVLEADEWKGTFWHYHPDIIIWTTIDREHLDFYRNFAGVRRGFIKFLKNLKGGGIIIANGDDPTIRKLVKASKKKHYFYSLENTDAKKVKNVLRVPGEHNVSNALAVLTLAKILRIPMRTALTAIGNYRGAWRRFEYKGSLKGAPVYDDYGHHPTEIRATLNALHSKFASRRIICVYQPHQFQRTKYLFKDFSEAFRNADLLVLLNIYSVAGREKKTITPGVSSTKLAQAIRKNGTPTVYKSGVGDAARFLQLVAQPNDVILIMGAGDIWKIYPLLQLKDRTKTLTW